MVMRGVFGGGLAERAEEEGRVCRVVVVAADIVGGLFCVLGMNDGDALKRGAAWTRKDFHGN